MDLHGGSIVALDGDVVAIRLHKDQIDREPEHAIASVSDPKQAKGNKGDLVLVSRFDDVLICRYFVCPWALNRDPIDLGDLVSFHPGQSHEVAQAVKAGTAEWFTP